ncbi:hypothetical protein HNP73_003023 [Amaricoccus macauensis]|uniref:Uncharacterized protein n=1 Tax=Amaricoccus macauensis TaxID=57001 RepID=A0A840STB9_9RHOB|nr:hypothetical protein [Amaricoccus macauensis]
MVVYRTMIMRRISWGGRDVLLPDCSLIRDGRIN